MNHDELIQTFPFVSDLMSLHVPACSDVTHYASAIGLALLRCSPKAMLERRYNEWYRYTESMWILDREGKIITQVHEEAAHLPSDHNRRNVFKVEVCGEHVWQAIRRVGVRRVGYVFRVENEENRHEGQLWRIKRRVWLFKRPRQLYRSVNTAHVDF